MKYRMKQIIILVWATHVSEKRLSINKETNKSACIFCGVGVCFVKDV